MWSSVLQGNPHSSQRRSLQWESTDLLYAAWFHSLLSCPAGLSALYLCCVYSLLIPSHRALLHSVGLFGIFFSIKQSISFCFNPHDCLLSSTIIFFSHSLWLCSPARLPASLLHFFLLNVVHFWLVLFLSHFVPLIKTQKQLNMIQLILLALKIITNKHYKVMGLD